MLTLLNMHSRPVTAARLQRQPAVSCVAAAINIGPYTFPTKQEARWRCQRLLEHTPQGKAIPKASDDGTFLWYLLQQHPRAQAKIGSGISHFSVITSRLHGNYRTTTYFLLHRTDGTATDFSYRKCLEMASLDAAPAGGINSNNSSGHNQTGPNSSTATATDESAPKLASPQSVHHNQQQQHLRALPDGYIRKALRIAVAAQTISYKRETFSRARAAGKAPLCALSNVPLTYNTSEVDHAAPNTFKQLVHQWLQQEGLTLQEVQLNHGDNTASDMASETQRQSWQLYHQEHAVLRLLDRKVHWQLTDRDRRSKSASSSGSSSSSDTDGSDSSSSISSGASAISTAATLSNRSSNNTSTPVVCTITTTRSSSSVRSEGSVGSEGSSASAGRRRRRRQLS